MVGKTWAIDLTLFVLKTFITLYALQWRHNGLDGVSNHQPHDCLFGRRSKKTPKIRATGVCAGNSPGPVNSPHKWPVTRKMFPFDDVIMGYETIINTAKMMYDMMHQVNKMIVTSVECWLAACFVVKCIINEKVGYFPSYILFSVYCLNLSSPPSYILTVMRESKFYSPCLLLIITCVNHKYE